MRPYPKSDQIGSKKENTYLCSDGSRVTQKQIDAKLKIARRQKGKKLGCSAYGNQYNIDEHGPIDCDHTISVARCKAIGKTELVWHIGNIEHSSRSAHMEWERPGSGEFEDHLNVVRRMKFLKLHDYEGFQKRLRHTSKYSVMREL